MSERFREKKRFVRYKEGARLYGLCQSTFEKRAKEAGATYKVGKAVIVDCEIFEKYLESFRILFVLRKIFDISYYGKYNSM